MDWQNKTGFVIQVFLALGITFLIFLVIGILQDLNSSLQELKNNDVALANLIVQGALLNQQTDENDLFVQTWREQCDLSFQDYNAKLVYYACKTR